MDYFERDQKTQPKRFEHFVTLANKKHGLGTYSYVLTKEDYVSTRKKVRITCTKCNETFITLPQSHTAKLSTRKGACSKCHTYGDKVRTKINIRWKENRVERLDTFLNQMKIRHEGLYLYPHINKEFKDESSIVTVHCTKCDDTFRSKVECLKKKNRYAGCPSCNKENMKNSIAEKNKIRQERNYAMKDLPHPFGFIYKIINTKNGKFYIGYTNMTVERRFKSHIDESRRLARGLRKCMSYLHNAMNYHGIESFAVEVLESFKDISPIELGQAEMNYIAELKPHYNLSAGGELGNKKRTF